MADISVRAARTLVNEDQRWIGPGGITALRDNATITLDRSVFDLVTAFPNGVIPSGVVLGRITATGLYAPYGGRASEVQTINLGAATAGTITITFDGETTGSVAYNATATTVQTALEGLSNVNSGDITVTGGPLPGTVTLTFGGRYLGVNVAQVTVTPTGLTGGTVTVATTTEGGSTVSDGRQTAQGFLAVSVPYDRDSAATADLVSALYWHGEVVEAFLPTGHGLDAAARADLAAKFRFVA